MQLVVWIYDGFGALYTFLKRLLFCVLVLAGVAIFFIALALCPPISPLGLLWLYVLFCTEPKR